MNPDKSQNSLVASKPKVVFDLYEWLPSYGESKVFFRTTAESSLEVEILYDVSSEGAKLSKKKSILFDGVCSFCVSACPGVSVTSIDYHGSVEPGALMEFTDSEPARLWQRHFSWRKNLIRHFDLFFMAENLRLEVFAEECRLIDGSE